MTVEPRDITRTLRILYPHVDLATRGTGPGEFTVTMPATSARDMGFGRDNGYAADWISRLLGERVRIAAVDFPAAILPARSARRDHAPARAGQAGPVSAAGCSTRQQADHTGHPADRRPGL